MVYLCRLVLLSILHCVSRSGSWWQDIFLCSPILWHFLGGTWNAPKPDMYSSRSSMFWVCLLSPPKWTCLGYLQREAFRRHPDLTPEPPQLAPFNDLNGGLTHDYSCGFKHTLTDKLRTLPSGSAFSARQQFREKLTLKQLPADLILHSWTQRHLNSLTWDRKWFMNCYLLMVEGIQHWSQWKPNESNNDLVKMEKSHLAQVKEAKASGIKTWCHLSVGSPNTHVDLRLETKL